MNYQQAKIEANDNSVGNGNGSKFNFAKVASEGLGDNVHGVRSDAAEDGGTHDLPQLLGFNPHP